MVQYFQLGDFKTWITPQGNTGILVSNSKKYYDILRDAFPDYHFGPIWPDQYNKYEWGTYINGIQDEQRQEVIHLLELFQGTVCIHDSLNQTFALDMHTNPALSGIGRTTIGELVYRAKPYKRIPTPEHKANALNLASHFVNFINHHPSYESSDFIVPVPFYGNKPFDLPSFLADEICKKTGISSGAKFVRKIKNTKAMKDATEEDKFNNIKDAFEVSKNAPFRGKRVTIIDDIYQSGNTLHELGSVLKNAGALVQGFVATKTLRQSNKDI